MSEMRLCSWTVKLGLTEVGNQAKKKKKHISPTLNNDRWIGRGGPTVWPPRSPDLTPMDYFLLGHIKALIYVTSLFWRWCYCLYCWGNNLALLSAQVVLCCVALRCVLRSVPVRLNICSKLLRNVTFVLYIIKWFCFISNLSHTQFDGPAAKNHLRHTVSSQQIIVLVRHINSRSSDTEFLHTLYIKTFIGFRPSCIVQRFETVIFLRFCVYYLARRDIS